MRPKTVRTHELMKLPPMVVSRFSQFCFVSVVSHGVLNVASIIVVSVLRVPEFVPCVGSQDIMLRTTLQHRLLVIRLKFQLGSLL